jgi:hypothetical protein
MSVDPDTSVWHVAQHRQKSGDDIVFHTDKTCRYLQREHCSGEKKRKVLPDSWRQCKACAGNVEAKGKGDHSLNEFLAMDSTTPDAVGMSKIGER